jgi:hypothetical protein
MKKFPIEKTPEQICEQYKTLNEITQQNLCDYYNSFMLLGLLTLYTEEQRQSGLEIVEEKSKEGRKAFAGVEGRRDMIVRFMELKTPAELPEPDKQHLKELELLVDFANTEAEKHELSREEGKRIYEYLMPFLYGRLR